MKKHKFLIISILTFILFIVFFSEYNANETKKILDAERIKADERLRTAKEKIQQKDSTSIDIDSTFNNID